MTSSTFRSYFSQAWLVDTEKLIDYINTMLIQHRIQMHETWIDPPNYLSHLDEDERPLDPRVFTLGFARRFSRLWENPHLAQRTYPMSLSRNDPPWLR